MVKKLRLSDLYLPRRGQRFSLLPGPFPRPQRLWRESLPWDRTGQLIPERYQTMRIALGCEDNSPESNMYMNHFMDMLLKAQLLLRVIPLHNRCIIAPAQTPRENRARMDRWIPPGWKYNSETNRLKWTQTKRFASLKLRNFEIAPNEAPMIVGRSRYDEIAYYLNTEKSLARWLNNGQVCVFCLSENPTSKKNMY